MDLPDLKDLRKVIALCRSTGVRIIKIDNIEITLSDDAPPTKPRGKAAKAAQGTSKYPDVKFESGGPTEEELLFWSSPSEPGKDEPTEGAN